MHALKILAGAVVALAAFAATAVAQEASQVVGSWRCDVPMPQGRLTTINSFRSDGTFVGYAENEDSSSGQRVHLGLIGSGEWVMRGADLVEIVKHYDLLFLSVGGASISPDSDLWRRVGDNVATTLNQENVRTVVSINATEKAVRADGGQITCRRP